MGDVKETLQKYKAFISAPRFILVTDYSEFIHKEYEKDPRYVRRPPVYKDYALLKVLFELRMKGKKRYKVHHFQYDEPTVPIDMSGLQDDEIIFVVAHGSQKGIYAMGPHGTEGTKRFVEKLLTADGNLKTKRKGKDITILLLSCRSGLGLHKAVARKLLKKLERDVKVGGAIGFTFGSPRTYEGYNEVLIRGLPWFMEYPNIDEYKGNPAVAERETSAREGKTITYDGKKAEIKKFEDKKVEIEKGFQKMVDALTSTEVNKALDELEKKFPEDWRALMNSQYELYVWAKDKSNLEFDMWYYDWIDEGYVWTTGAATTDAEVDAILAGDLPLTDAGAASVK
ncbi:MAG TPA: hypothetical protein VGJ37_07375 [Pyrinomonadaceae bacterium]|jgi:hypothetical protein